jgi:hypothetical protein
MIFFKTTYTQPKMAESEEFAEFSPEVIEVCIFETIPIKNTKRAKAQVTILACFKIRLCLSLSKV